MEATTTTEPGHDLRAARKRAGLTRAELAILAGCSMASLGNIEAGVIPKRSAVRESAWAVIDSLNDNDARSKDAAVKEPGKQARRDPE
jgi:transcriptional regulator with XRE-family HTH domain